MDIVSCCCGAPIKWHDICTECLEHCEPIDLDEDETDERDYPALFGGNIK